MNSIKSICAGVLLAGALAVPALAQMASEQPMKPMKPMKMSVADKRMMAKCNAMTHDMMMKNKTCMKIMKMHPDMMKGG